MTAAIRRYRRLVWTASAGAWIAGWLLAAPAAAQWRNLPTGSVPLGADGKPDMSATTPRTPDGKPDLSGIYTPNMRYFQNLAADLGLENVQTDTLVVLVYEAFNLWRQVFLDSREFADDLNPSWLGYSKGHWEGDALVVETRGLNGKQWLDHGGLPASERLTVLERFRRPTYGRLEIELTITDPTYYTKPWTVTTNARRTLGTELFEFICNENEKSTPHMGPHIK